MLMEDIDIKIQIEDRISDWLSKANDCDIVTQSLIDKFYDETNLHGFDSLGHFRRNELTKLLGRSFEDFKKALRNINIKQESPWGIIKITLPKM